MRDEQQVLTEELRGLATELHRRHYAHVPQWRVSSDPRGALSQIDNMIAGLASRLEGLATIGQLIASDLRYVRESRKRKGLDTTTETHCIPPYWPAYGQLCNWLDAISPAQAIEARRAIDSEAGVVGDESAVPATSGDAS